MSKFKVGDRVVEDKSIRGADLVQHWNTFWKRTEGELVDESFVVTRSDEFYTHYSNRVGGRGPQTEHRYLKLAPLKIEAGKFYKTRDGRKVGPVQWHYGVDGWIVNLGDGSAWRKDDTVRNGAVIRSDLVAEWVDETKASNDNAAPSKFKVGDVVRRHISTASGVIERIDSSSYHINYGTHWGYRDFREDELILVAAAPVSVKPTAIVALIENGQPKPSANPFVHSSTEAAVKEAARLAGKYLGKKFGVYVLQSTEELPAPTYKHEWQRLAATGEKIAAIKELRGITGLGLKATKDAVEYWLAHDEPVSRIAA